MFTRLYNFLLDINFLNALQSGSCLGDSTVNQLVYKVHKINEAFERGKEVPLLGWLTSYLYHRKQRVVIDGQSSNWRNVSADVPQGSFAWSIIIINFY